MNKPNPITEGDVKGVKLIRSRSVIYFYWIKKYLKNNSLHHSLNLKDLMMPNIACLLKEDVLRLAEFSGIPRFILNKTELN